MSIEPGEHCGHDCCDEPRNPHHSHFLDASDCLQCRRVREEREAFEVQIREMNQAIDDIVWGSE